MRSFILLMTGCTVAPAMKPTSSPVDDTAVPPVEDSGCVAQVWFTDADGDGSGDPDTRMRACVPEPGQVDNGDDCDDTTSSRRPDLSLDQCDGLDNDCDGDVDEDVKADWILVSVDSNAGQIVQIDPTTGATAVLSLIDGSYTGSLNSMDARDKDGLSVVHDNAGVLHSLDACTGDLTLLGPTGAGDMGGISFAGTGKLYGISQSSDQLMTLDPVTGAATPVGALGFNLGASGIAYDCTTDTLYGADASGAVFQVDTETGRLHSFVSTGVPFNGVGLAFDPVSGQLLASTGRSNSLWSVDPVTGRSTEIGPLGTVNADDLALHPPCE